MSRARTVRGLRRRAVLSRPDRVDDGGGGHPATFTPVATVWAHLDPGSVRETADADTLISRASARVRIRWRADVRAGWRLAIAPREYRVRGVVDPQADKKWLMLECEEEVR